MPLPLIALLMVADAPYDLTAYRTATRAEVPCNRTAATDEVTVCGRREADRRYRVPLVTIPVRDRVLVERDRLLEDKIDRCGRGAFMTGCGFVGATVGTTFGGPGAKAFTSTRKLKE